MPLPSNLGSVSDFTQSSRVWLSCLSYFYKYPEVTISLYHLLENFWMLMDMLYRKWWYLDLHFSKNWHLSFGWHCSLTWDVELLTLSSAVGSRKNKAFPTCLNQNLDYVKRGPRRFGNWWIFTTYWKITPFFSGIRIIL